jgi:hypothetical protein
VEALAEAAGHEGRGRMEGLLRSYSVGLEEAARAAARAGGGVYPGR